VVEVVTWSLEVTDRSTIHAAAEPADAPLLMPALRPAPELSRFFYLLVGDGWGWTDRLGWTPQRWTAWVDRPEHHLVTAWHDGVPAGYYELEEQPDDERPGTVELAYFGLAPSAIGRGWGGWLLSRALVHAFDLPGTRRVWVHTCTLDHPNALANYEARGFVRYAQRRHERA
jgi:GNAT superfamily N-acetyltransferase